jgi:hypothetical protein
MRIDGASMDSPVGATLVLATCAALVAFCSPTAADGAAVPAGAWGGEHIALQVTAAGATVEFDCAHGTIDSQLTLDSAGRFDVPGTITPERGGPTRADEPAQSQPARYSGSLKESTLTLTVQMRDSNDTIGVFTLKQNSNPRIFKCR